MSILRPIFFILLIAGTAAAGTARLVALGAEGGYVADSADALRWYASLVDHPDRLILEAGDVGGDAETALSAQGLVGHGGGAHLALDEAGRWGVLGVHFRDRLGKGPTDGAVSILWCRSFGGWEAGLAGHFSTFGFSSSGTDVGDRIDSQYFHTYGFGLRRALGADARFELAAETVHAMTEYGDALGHLAVNGWDSWGARARLHWQVSDDLTLVPLADHRRRLHGDWSAILSAPADREARLTVIGVGLLVRRDAETTFLAGLEYRSGAETLRRSGAEQEPYEWDLSERDFYQIRARAGLETRLLPWLTVRAAVRYARLHEDRFRSVADPDRNDDRRHEDVATPVSVGFSAVYGDLTIDAAVADDAPLNPGLGAEGLFFGEADRFTSLTMTWLF